MVHYNNNYSSGTSITEIIVGINILQTCFETYYNSFSANPEIFFSKMSEF